MDRKKYTFIVETVYEQIYNKQVDDKTVQDTTLSVQRYSFTNDDYNKAYNKARAEMDRVIRYGLSLSGGAVVKSVIHPSAIKQVGIIDLDKFEAEAKAMEDQESSDSTNDVQTDSGTESRGNPSNLSAETQSE